MIAIVDCNSFYASCERLFRPGLRNKPIVVLSNNDGCVIARTDDAKELGIAMGAVFHKVKRELEEKGIHYFSSNYQLYGDISDRVMRCLQHINPNIEVYSIDEAFLDLRDVDFSKTDYIQYGTMVRDTVMKHTGIPISIGIAPTKVLAKVANRLSKKNKQKTGGVMAITTTEEIEAALNATPLDDVWGIGYRKASKMKMNFGFFTAYDCYKSMTDDVMRKQFGGVVGLRVLRELRGQRSIEVSEGLVERKHIAATRSFSRPVSSLSELKEAIATYAERALQKMEAQQTACKTVGVYVRTNPFNREGGYYSKTNYGSLIRPTTNPTEIIEKALELVTEIYLSNYKYLKAGVFLSGFEHSGEMQLDLFDDPDAFITEQSKHDKLAALLATSEKKFGKKQISIAAAGIKPTWQMRMSYRSPLYTTSWADLPNVGPL